MGDIYLARTEPLAPGRPSVSDDLIALYGLSDLAASVARTDPQTGAKRKLRKSYKNHIADLSGKHPIPQLGDTPYTLGELARRPPVETAEVPPFAPDLLSSIRFERSPSVGLPGFDVKLLATYGQQQDPLPEVARDDSPRPVERRRRRDNGASPVVEKRRKLQ